jgi:hypothetical protein
VPHDWPLKLGASYALSAEKSPLFSEHGKFGPPKCSTQELGELPYKASGDSAAMHKQSLPAACAFSLLFEGGSQYFFAVLLGQYTRSVSGGGFLHMVGDLLVSPAQATINLRLNALISSHVVALDWSGRALFVGHDDCELNFHRRKKVRTDRTVLRSY